MEPFFYLRYANPHSDKALNVKDVDRRADICKFHMKLELQKRFDLFDDKGNPLPHLRMVQSRASIRALELLSLGSQPSFYVRQK